MQTQCPECQTTYRITDAQLEAAQGRVRCGQCTTIFNARDNIVQEEQTPSEAEQPASQQEEAALPSEPEVGSSDDFTQDSALTDQDLGEDLFQSNDSVEDDLDDLAGFSLDDDDDGLALSEAFANDASSDATEEKAEDDDDFDLMPQAIDTDNEEEDPPAFEETDSFDLDDSDEPFNQDAAKGQSDSGLDKLESALADDATLEERYPWLNWVWIAGTPILLILLVFQYLYFIHSDLAADPGSRGFAEGFCSIAGCTVPPYRDLAKLAITEKEIRSHPSVKNALIIRASIINQASIPQAYPRLEIRLLDVNSGLVSARRFEPQEYLDADVVFEAGMLPGMPVLLNLETQDPGSDVVAFEFDFV